MFLILMQPEVMEKIWKRKDSQIELKTGLIFNKDLSQIRHIWSLYCRYSKRKL